VFYSTAAKKLKSIGQVEAFEFRDVVEHRANFAAAEKSSVEVDDG
jgi:hypothetical protein